MLHYDESTGLIVPRNDREPQELTEAKTALLMACPFFSIILFERMKIVFNVFIQTLATDGTHLFINPTYFSSLTLGQRIFALAHEVAHAMWRHMDRAKHYMGTGFLGQPFSQYHWNVATDLIINAMLKRAEVGAFKEEWLLDPRITGDEIADDVYAQLLKEYPPDRPGRGRGGEGGDEGEGGGSGSEEGEPEDGQGSGRPKDSPYEDGTLDDHIPAIDPVSEYEWKQTVEAAAAAAKAQGKLPAGMQRWVDDIVEPQVPWRERLRNAVIRVSGRENRTWKKFSRRKMAHQRVYLPGRTGYGMKCAVVGIDTSGSVSNDELKAFLGELSGILSEVRVEELWALPVDARVDGATKLDQAEDLIAFVHEKVKGGGGTDMTEIFQWIKDNGKEPDVCVILTDGYTPFGEQQSYSVLWVMSSDSQHVEDAPHGETIRIHI